MSFARRSILPIGLVVSSAVLGALFQDELSRGLSGNEALASGPGSQPASRPASQPTGQPVSKPVRKRAKEPVDKLKEHTDEPPKSRPASQRGKVAHYTCSMHPSVAQAGPGTCPICSMDLMPVTEEDVKSGMIFVDAVRRQKIGVRTEPVKRRRLERRIEAVGTVTYDESRLFDVNLRVSGWIEKLFVDETGQKVAGGQPLFLLYSPELYTAEAEHLSALARGKERPDALRGLARASRRRLRLLGLADAQIAALEKDGTAREAVPIQTPARGFVVEKNAVEGAHVEAGMRVYRIADLGRVWVDARIFESDLSYVRAGQTAIVSLPHAGAEAHQAKVDYVHPTLDPKTRTAKVRVALPNPDLTLKPDMYANVEIAVDLGEHLAVPESAVIYTGPRRLVFLDLGEGRLRPKVVKLGAHTGGYYAVLEGLAEGDVVVTSGNFLIAAESRIRSAAKYWETGHGTE